MMLISLFLLLCSFLTLFQSCEGSYATTTTKRMIGKILKMNIEIMKDIDNKIRSIQNVAFTYQKTGPFQLGQQRAEIDSIYKAMLRIRDKADDTHKWPVYSPTLTWFAYATASDRTMMSTIDRISLVTECQQKAMMIDKLLLMMEEENRSKRKRSEWGIFVHEVVRRQNEAPKINKKDYFRQMYEARAKLQKEIQEIKKGSNKSAPTIKPQKDPEEGFDTD